MKVMLTNADSRKTFDVFNILRNKKIDVILISERSNYLLRLAYRQKVFPSVDNFLENCNSDILFFPLDEDEIKNYYLRYSKDPHLHSILPEEKSFDLVRDKLLLAEYCLGINIKVPCLISFNTIDDMKLSDFPLVCKPRIGNGALGVTFIDKPAGMLNLKYDSSYFFQKKIVSRKKVFGAFFFMYKGKVLSYYSHERIRTFPFSGGVSILSKSANNLVLKEIGGRLLSSLDWSGIAMLEFMFDDISNEYNLIEINPRAWGSFMLSEYCGASFIDSYIKATEYVINQKFSQIKPKDSKITEGKFIRWIFPWDIYLLFKKKITLKDFFHFDKSKTCFINCSGSSIIRSLFIHMYYIFDKSIFIKFIQKVRGSKL